MLWYLQCFLLCYGVVLANVLGHVNVASSIHTLHFTECTFLVCITMLMLQRISWRCGNAQIFRTSTENKNSTRFFFCIGLYLHPRNLLSAHLVQELHLQEHTGIHPWGEGHSGDDDASSISVSKIQSLACLKNKK